jgi:uridylate kinase
MAGETSVTYGQESAILLLMQKDYIIAVGGSIICPDKVNTEYLKALHAFIRGEIRDGKRFILVVGGGAPARTFQKAAAEVVDVPDEDKDWLGIHATRLNAHLLRTVFREEANPVIFEARGKITEFGSYPLIIGAGWRPGWSTDFVTVQIAVDFKNPQAIILGKPEFVYDKDNQAFPDAKPYVKMTWEEYMKLVPAKWSPGIHAPVDPVAAKLAQKEKLRVIVAGGKDLQNVKDILDGKDFRGTTIE